MQIEYTTPQADYLAVTVTLDDTDTQLTASEGPAECVYRPEAVVGLRAIPVGKFTARGDSGRVEEATVLFDLRKGEFVIQPKKLVAGGFDFDKPAQPEPAQTDAAATEPAAKDTQPPVPPAPAVTPNKK